MDHLCYSFCPISHIFLFLHLEGSFIPTVLYLYGILRSLLPALCALTIVCHKAQVLISVLILYNNSWFSVGNSLEMHSWFSTPAESQWRFTFLSLPSLCWNFLPSICIARVFYQLLYIKENVFQMFVSLTWMILLTVYRHLPGLKVNLERVALVELMGSLAGF